MAVIVGCCGFPGARARYFRSFPAVEVQQTFYKPPATSTLERWRAEALRARIVLFQCPASFRPEEENIRNLRAFCEGVDRRGLLFAWEPRGEWPPDLVRGLCRDLDLLHVVDPLQGRSLHGTIHSMEADARRFQSLTGGGDGGAAPGMVGRAGPRGVRESSVTRWRRGPS